MEAWLLMSIFIMSMCFYISAHPHTRALSIGEFRCTAPPIDHFRARVAGDAAFCSFSSLPTPVNGWTPRHQHTPCASSGVKPRDSDDEDIMDWL